jgi:hypothetical protein
MNPEIRSQVLLPFMGFVPLVLFSMVGVYSYVTAHLSKWEPRWYRASELKKEFPEIFDEKRDRIENLIYDDNSQLYAAKGVPNVDVDGELGPYEHVHSAWPQLCVAEDVTDDGERWCVLTPVYLGKWRICNIWWLSLSGLCITVPVFAILFTVRIPLSVSSNIAVSAAVI